MKRETIRDVALWLWGRELGQPYKWGGDDAIDGWDCSGLIIEILKAVGVLPRVGDWASWQLADEFRPKMVTKPTPGCLLFWNRGGRIGHVEVVWKIIGTHVLTIGAAGGGSATQTEEDAAAQNAYVKVRPARQGWVLAVDPFR